MNKLKDNLIFALPGIIAFALFAVSLSYGFRSFDENLLIEDFYTGKTFSEYLEKLMLIHFGGTSEAFGFTFSSVKNIHVSILGIPTFYLISYLFKVTPFLFHAWGLFLHISAVTMFTLFCYELTSKKHLAIFAGVIWAILPTNVEPVIWATNWAQPLGATLYFTTLYLVAKFAKAELLNMKSSLIITILVIIQILFTEHTITIPLSIFFTALLISKDNTKIIKFSSLPILTIICYWLTRTLLIASATATNNTANLLFNLKRIFILSPQIFFHQLKILIFPRVLTIDQLDQLQIGGMFSLNHIISISVLIIFILAALFIFKTKNLFSYGLLLFLICILPFIQTIPLYSMSAERYNYFGSAFICLALVSLLTIKVNKKAYSTILILLTLLSFGRSFARVQEWENSTSLFESAVNNSKSDFKKGAWKYNVAISKKDDSEKTKDLVKSNSFLVSYLKEKEDSSPVNDILSFYELDKKSILAKAALRLSTNYEILEDEDKQFSHLHQAKELSRKDTQIKALVYKNLGTYYFKNNNLEKAIDYYKKSIAISPSPSIDYAIAACYLKSNDLSRYEKHLKKAVSVISPYNVSPFKAYGQYLEMNKKDLKAAAKYYKIATLLEDDSAPYYLLGLNKLSQMKVDESLKVALNGLNSFPGNPNLLYLHGVISINKGKTHLGIKELREVANSESALKDVRLNASQILVDILIKQKKLVEAAKYNKIALSIDPKNIEALKMEKMLRNNDS